MDPLGEEEARGVYEPLTRFEDEGQLLNEENYEWGAFPNLDRFFNKLFSYYQEKGFRVIIISRVLNLLTLLFTILFSAFLLLFVNWGQIHDCGKRDDCNVAEVCFNSQPLKHMSFWKAMVVIYLTIFSLYFLLSLFQFFSHDMKELIDVKDFVNNKLGTSDHELQTLPWPDLVDRLVKVQATTRLSIVRDYTAHDIIGRIMRKENYFIAMLNKHVLALHMPIPGMRDQVMISKFMEWSLYFCVYDAMFDDKFMLKREFVENPGLLADRFRKTGVLALLLSPFLMVFAISYLFLQNAEHFYRHPVSAGARQWSLYARWRMREFNELEDRLNARLDAGYGGARKYVMQFPTPIQTQIARFVAFIAGSFAATCLAIGVVSGPILEKSLPSGQNFIWYTAFFGIILAISRAFIPEEPVTYDPEGYMAEVVESTHYYPRRWRGRCHTKTVQREFAALFKLKVVIFLEEIASIFFTPVVLFCSLPACAPEIAEFVRDFTVEVEGVGHVCSLATFDFERHGNAKYGSRFQGEKRLRSKQGKMEKSFVTFCSEYARYEPDEHGKEFLGMVQSAMASGAGGSLLGASAAEEQRFGDGVENSLGGFGRGGGEWQDAQAAQQQDLRLSQMALQHLYGLAASQGLQGQGDHLSPMESPGLPSSHGNGAGRDGL